LTIYTQSSDVREQAINKLAVITRPACCANG
jgi:hypothetical protein